MLPRVKILFFLAIVVMVSFACGTSAPKPTSTPAIDTAATKAAQVAAEKATAKAQAALNDKATADAKAAADIQATADAKNAQATADKAAANAKATTDAKAALDAKATMDAKAALDAKATADTKSTADAQAALDTKATADAQAAQEAAATATQKAKLANQQATETAVAAKATQAAEAILSVVKEDLTKIGMSADTGKLGWMQSGSEIITIGTPGTFLYKKFAENLVASDFVIKSDITWKAEGGIVICGLIFRSEANFDTGKQYIFQYLRLSGLPGWDIEFWKDGRWSSTITGDIKFASSIKMDNGASNKFILAAQGEKFTLYINDQRIGSFYDYSKSRLDGRFAYYGWEEAGTSSCEFENTWVWLLK